MMLTKLFYDVISTMINISKSIPGETDIIFYDPRFTPEEIIENNDVNIGIYKYIFDELDEMSNNRSMKYITCSTEIGIENITNDYIYYIGMINDNTIIMYMRSVNHLFTPSIIEIYDQKYNITVRSNSKTISFCETNDVKDVLMSFDRERILSYLRN